MYIDVLIGPLLGLFFLCLLAAFGVSVWQWRRRGLSENGKVLFQATSILLLIVIISGLTYFLW